MIEIRFLNGAHLRVDGDKIVVGKGEHEWPATSLAAAVRILSGDLRNHRAIPGWRVVDPEAMRTLRPLGPPAEDRILHDLRVVRLSFERGIAPALRDHTSG